MVLVSVMVASKCTLKQLSQHCRLEIESRKLVVVLYAVYSNKTRSICILWSFVTGNNDNGKLAFVFSLFQNTYWRENTHSLITKGTGLPWCQGAWVVFLMHSSPCLPGGKFIKAIEWIPGWGRLSYNWLYFMGHVSLFCKLIHCGWVTKAVNLSQRIIRPRTALRARVDI